MAQVRCSICGKPFDSDTSRWLPFCSPRCKQMDLGRWLDERYGMPQEPEDEQPRQTPSGEEEDA